MNERLKFEGRLSEKKREKDRLELRIKGMIDAVRDKLDPSEDISMLEIKVAAEEMLQLASYHAEFLAIIEDIEAIKKILGRD